MDFDGFYEQIKKDELGRVYLIMGEDEFIKARALELLLATLDETARQFNYADITAPDNARLLSECEQLPLMAQRRIVVVREATQFDNESGNEVAKRIEALPDTTCLVFYQRGKVMKKALYKAIEAQKGIVQIDALPPARAMKWAAERAKKRGCTLERDAANTLIMLYANSTLELAQAVDLACDYTGGGSITNQTLDAVLQSSAEFDYIKAVSAFSSGDFQKGMEHVQARLRDKKSGDAMGLLMSFSSMVLDLLEAKRLLEVGTAQSAAAALGGNPYAAKMRVKEAQRMDKRALEEAVLAFADADYGVKSGRVDEETALITALCTAFGPQ